VKPYQSLTVGDGGALESKEQRLVQVPPSESTDSFVGPNFISHACSTSICQETYQRLNGELSYQYLRFKHKSSENLMAPRHPFGKPRKSDARSSLPVRQVTVSDTTTLDS
jgi:hypothetical protein